MRKFNKGMNWVKHHLALVAGVYWAGLFLTGFILTWYFYRVIPFFKTIPFFIPFLVLGIVVWIIASCFMGHNVSDDGGYRL